jgi:protein-tyrosine phosphatase
MKTVLFLCTGNYYRSRFAEELFNHQAKRAELNWTAQSRGLALERGIDNVGPISAFAARALRSRQVAIGGIHRLPQSCTVSDLQRADLIIALDEDEHRSLLAERFPPWENRVEYWRVPDIEILSPKAALSGIEKQIALLVSRLGELE